MVLVLSLYLVLYRMFSSPTRIKKQIKLSHNCIPRIVLRPVCNSVTAYVYAHRTTHPKACIFFVFRSVCSKPVYILCNLLKPPILPSRYETLRDGPSSSHRTASVVFYFPPYPARRIIFPVPASLQYGVCCPSFPPAGPAPLFLSWGFLLHIL